MPAVGSTLERIPHKAAASSDPSTVTQFPRPFQAGSATAFRKRRAGAKANSAVTRQLETDAARPAGVEALNAIGSALAHEVRGPLRWVTSFSELLVQEGGLTLNQAGKDYLQRISGAAARLDNVMRDLQSFVGMSVQEPNCQTISLDAAACAVVGNLSGVISAKEAKVTLVRPLPAVIGDPDWLRQSLARLLDNALKFVPPGVHPSVRIRAESLNGVVRLYVEDDGIGIPAVHHPRIFGLFTRLDHEFPGTGASLALTRLACERMGGQVGVHSEPGKGSRFWIELPSAT